MEPSNEGPVLMPWNDINNSIIYNDGSENVLFQRWDLIKYRLKSHIKDINHLIDIIRSYNVSYNENGVQLTSPWSFQALRELIETMSEEERLLFFNKDGLLNSIQNLVLQSIETCKEIKWLCSGTENSLTLHQLQISCLLANAFFCTYPKRFKNQPSINFSGLFEGGKRKGRKPTHVEKLKCILHYFKRIREKQPSGYVSFYRRCTSPERYPRWDRCSTKLCDIKVESSGFIEDQAGFLQMDFANRTLGGGVLAWGCVQEEIRFIICPELIAARLFCDPMTDNEAFIIIGAERYCKFGGYSDEFYFDGNYNDETPFDSEQRKATQILCVDALCFRPPQDQYREGKILRELKKIYTGLSHLPNVPVLPLATGNWGCGVYHGDPELKSLLQIMAASETGRTLTYFTFGNNELKEGMLKIHSQLQELNITVGQLYRVLTRYIKDRRKNQSVFNFVSHGVLQYVGAYSFYHSSTHSDQNSQKRSFNSMSNFNKIPKIEEGQPNKSAMHWTEKENNIYKTSASHSARSFSPKNNSQTHFQKLVNETIPDSGSIEDSDDLIPCTPEKDTHAVDVFQFYNNRKTSEAQDKHENPDTNSSFDHTKSLLDALDEDDKERRLQKLNEAKQTVPIRPELNFPKNENNALCDKSLETRINKEEPIDTNQGAQSNSRFTNPTKKYTQKKLDCFFSK